MSDPESTTYARELIRLFAAALHDLSGGQPIPKAWRIDIDRALSPAAAKRGPKPSAATLQREMNWAKAMVGRRMQTSDKITAFAEQLAEESTSATQTFTAQDVFGAERRWRIEALAATAMEQIQADDRAQIDKKQARAANITRRQSAGETLDDILGDPDLAMEDFSMIRQHQKSGEPLGGAPGQPTIPTYAERSRGVVRWIMYGLSLGIGNDPPELLALNEASRRAMLPRSARRRATAPR
jgi:hypothetical protein